MIEPKILDTINNMITEYSDMECDNHVKYPLDSEVELYRKGRYGVMALEELLRRLEILQVSDITTEGNKRTNKMSKKNKLPTEAQLEKNDKLGYRKFASHKNETDKKIGLIDLQDGTIHHWSSVTIKLNKKVINSITKVIEEWMDCDPSEGSIELPIKTTDGDTYNVGFQKYIINFQKCNNGCEQWLFVKCRLHGYPKIYSKHLGTFMLNRCPENPFVHNQVFPSMTSDSEGYREESSFLILDKIIE